MCPQIKKLHAIAASTGGTIFPYATDIMVPIASQSSSILGATSLDQETQLSIHESNLEKMREKKAKDYAKRDTIRRRKKSQQAKKIAEQQQKRQRQQWLSYKEATVNGNMAPVMLDRDTIAVRKKRKAQLAIAPNAPCFPKFALSKFQKDKDKSDKWTKTKTHCRGY